jgi:hypothetical protein
MIVNPKPFLTDLTGKPVSVKLKWGMEYKGDKRKCTATHFGNRNAVGGFIAWHLSDFFSWL